MELPENIDIIKVFLLTTIAFVVTLAWTPLLTHYLYKFKMGKTIRETGETPIYSKLHQGKAGTPTMGGLLIWVTTAVLAIFFFVLANMVDNPFIDKLNFLNRSQTWLPLAALVASAIIGFIDDIFNIKGVGAHSGGLRVRHKLLLYTLIAVVGAWWFYYRLDWTTIHVPFVGNYDIGIWYVPIFLFIIVATAFSVNEIDGLDGLAGGTLLAAFGAFGAIAFAQGRMDLAAFCGVIIGSLLAFLWFNINPARFFMGDTGAMSLGVTLGIVAMLTNAALLLPIIGFMFVLVSGSVIIQIIARKTIHKKVFISSPLHHHLEARGWPEPKIVMRFWIIAAVTAVLGVIIFLVDR
ncbi:MAG: phospho-N-acetylmuramoyl-pentapeptide-transferase [Candidatus Kerfeldbacteria bacterium]|nr:phospho-N-acetylmuramoyl-pentapeptide-transferase [Candidatus Kerfeldbacteria bacterium]